MTENIRQYVKSIVYDTRNRVNDDMKCVGKGLWMKIVYFIIGRRQKLRFLHYFIRYGTENAAFAFKPKGMSKEITCIADSARIIIGNNIVGICDDDQVVGLADAESDAERISETDDVVNEKASQR